MSVNNTLKALIICLLLSFTSYSQQANLRIEHSPKKAALFSAVLPGLGQIYNKKYWKTPIVYAAIGSAVYGSIYNNQKYQLYKDAYIVRVDGNANTIDEFDPNSGNTEVYTEGQLRTLQDFYRNNRDLTIILSAVAYFINILDAYVDAHLFHFDVSEDLSASWSPTNFNIPSHNLGHQNTFGLRLSFDF